MNRLLLVMVLLCATVSCFAKRKIILNEQVRLPQPPIEIFIDDRMLEFKIAEDLGTLNILIEDISGNMVFNSLIEECDGSIPFALDLKKGTYVIIVTCRDYKLWGDFSIE